MRKVGKKRKKNGGEIATSLPIIPSVSSFCKERRRWERKKRRRVGAFGSARLRKGRRGFTGKPLSKTRRRVDGQKTLNNDEALEPVRTLREGAPRSGTKRFERRRVGVAQRRLSTGEYQRMKIKGRLSTGEYQRVKIKGKSRIIRRGGFRREALRWRSRPRPSKEPVRRVRATLRVRRRPRRF